MISTTFTSSIIAKNNTDDIIENKKINFESIEDLVNLDELPLKDLIRSDKFGITGFSHINSTGKGLHIAKLLKIISVLFCNSFLFP